MDCRSDCPEVCRRSEMIQEMNAKIDEMKAIIANNEKALQANRKTAETLAKLPSNRDTAEARRSLQEAVVLVNKAQEQATSSASLLNDAIELQGISTDALVNLCPGAPVEVPDSALAGHMILTCASPAFTTE